MTSSVESTELDVRPGARGAELRTDEGRATPAARAEAPPAPPDEPAPPPRPARRRWARWALFGLLPIALIGGAYVYVSGGQVTSVDDAYVEADKVGVSTDVSGIASQVDVA